MILNPKIFNMEFSISPQKSINLAQKVFCHELGHYIDTTGNFSKTTEWRKLSNWSKEKLPERIRSRYNQDGIWKFGKWQHDRKANFVSDYAPRNPKEDFCESVSLYLLEDDNWFSVKNCKDKLKFLKDKVFPQEGKIGLKENGTIKRQGRYL